MPPPPTDTQDPAYTQRLITRGSAWWKRLLPVQAPYRWNLRRLNLGFTLDIGCGIGRNLHHLRGHGVGVDHNPHSIATARARGLEAFTPDAFHQSAYNTPERFDAILLAHVAEHVTHDTLVEILRRHLPLLRPGGRVVLITPQERGYRSDASHVRFVTFEESAKACAQVGLREVRRYSFPFPRPVGRVFTHNEFVYIALKP